MRPKSYAVHLSPTERGQLLTQVNRGTQRARVLTRARILLLADEQLSDEEIAETLQVSYGGPRFRSGGAIAGRGSTPPYTIGRAAGPRPR
jgi:hypothetical protein